MEDRITFPATFDEFAEQYKIVDKQEVYTNGTELIPIFRVKQWLEVADVKTNPEWISVDERLPENEQMVLTIDTDGEMQVCFYETAWEGIFQQFHGLVKIYNITYWMPLPEAPKGKEDEGK